MSIYRDWLQAAKGSLVWVGRGAIPVGVIPTASPECLRGAIEPSGRVASTAIMNRGHNHGRWFETCDGRRKLGTK